MKPARAGVARQRKSRPIKERLFDSMTVVRLNYFAFMPSQVVAAVLALPGASC
jgi:hypothetical protein